MAAYAPFFYVYISALVGVELLLGAVFAVRAAAESSRKIALLAAAYAWSAPLAFVNFLALPGVPPGLPAGDIQAGPATWILWHLGWAALLAVYARTPEGRARRGRPLFAGVLALSLVAGAACIAFAHSLPALVDGRERMLPVFVGSITAAMALDAFVVVLLVRSRSTARDWWVIAAIALACLDSGLMFAAGVRFDLLFMLARCAGLASSLAMLGAVIADASSLVRRAAAELAGRERAAEFRRIADAMPQIVWQLDSSGRNVYANEQWSRYTGRERRAGSDERFAEAIHPDDLALRHASFLEAERAGAPYEATYRLRAADGTYRWFLTRAVRVVREGEGAYWVGTSTDVDDQIRIAQRLRLLAALGRALSQSLNMGVVLDAAVSVPVPEIADCIIIQLRDQAGQLVVTAAHDADRERRATLQRLIGESYQKPSTVTASASVAATLESVLLEDVSEATLRENVRPEFYDVFAGLQPRSSIVVPLFVGGTVWGVMNFIYAQSERRYAPGDVELVEEIGRRVALAIESAELYAREHHVADRLQRASLPAKLPKVEGVELDAVYQPGRLELQIGGDWYDAFASDDGRLVLSVGDIAGSGLEAAVAMSALRQAIRGAAEVIADPSAILNAADRVLAKHQPDRIATAFVGVLDRRDGLLRYASAGHPPAFLRRYDGGVVRLDCGGLPLGLRSLWPTGDDASCEIALDDGALLVLYTDGLTEAGRDALAGEAKLRGALDAAVDDVHPAEAIRTLVLGTGDASEHRDDIAVMTLRFDRPRASRERRFVGDLHDARVSAELRRAIVAVLREWPLSRAVLFDVELALGELLSNVVRYAPGSVEIALASNGASLALTVRDRGPGATFFPRLPVAAAESGRGLFIVSSIASELTILAREGGGSEIRAVFELQPTLPVAAPPSLIDAAG